MVNDTAYVSFMFNSTEAINTEPVPLNATVVLYIWNLGSVPCTFNVIGPVTPSYAYYQEIPLIQYYCTAVNATVGPPCHTYIGHYMKLMAES